MPSGDPIGSRESSHSGVGTPRSMTSEESFRTGRVCGVRTAGIRLRRRVSPAEKWDEDAGQRPVGPVPVARLNRVPLAGPVLEPSTPFGQIRAVLGMAGAVLGLDHPKAAVREQGEAVA
jgi:hypothetical protein